MAGTTLSNTEVIRYPQNLDDEHHVNSMMIFINDSQASAVPNNQLVSGSPIPISDVLEDGVMGGLDLFTSPIGSIENVREQFDIRNEQIQRHAIQLYLPSNLEYNSGIEWTRDELGNVASMAQFAGAIAATGEDADLGTQLKRLADSGIADRLMNETIDALMEAAGAIGNTAGVEIQSLAEKTRRRTRNNHMEVMFKSVQGRGFTFNFKFAPQSREEARAVHDIIFLLRYYAHPYLSGDQQILESGREGNLADFDVTGTDFGGNELERYGRFINYPAQFQVVFLTNGQENQTLPRIGSCALTNITQNYGPNEISTFDDTELPLPTEIDLSLEFTELHILNRRRISEGY